MLIAIDPGVQRSGVALFDDANELCWAKWLPNDWFQNLYDWPLVIEMPRIYPGSGQQKGDLNDLLNLAAVVGGHEKTFKNHVRVFPAQWKGQVPKKIMNARVLSKLSPEERLRIEDSGSKTHNTIDAVGIGLYRLGRL